MQTDFPDVVCYSNICMDDTFILFGDMLLEINSDRAFRASIVGDFFILSGLSSSGNSLEWVGASLIVLRRLF